MYASSEPERQSWAATPWSPPESDTVRLSEYAALPDEQLISLVCQRHEHALGALYDRYGTIVYSIALRITQDRRVAEEVVQDVFQAIWQSAPGFCSDGTPIAWMVSIARHRAIDTTRARGFRNRSREIVLEDIQVSGGYGHIDGIADMLSVREALLTLPTRHRQAIRLAYYGGLTHAEIAVHMNESIGTIKWRLRDGLLKLRDLLHVTGDAYQ